MVSLPDGLHTPVRRSMMPWPPSVPGIQTSSMAFECVSTSESSNGLPLKITVTIRGLTLLISDRRVLWIFGNVRCVRLVASPD